MTTLRNLAGNAVEIFLYRFELSGNDGIDFILNEAIANDMYPDIAEQMNPLVHACCETLLRYKHLSRGKIIMDGNFLSDGFEVMLSKGLGNHFVPEEKERLFQDAWKIAQLLQTVMTRAGQDAKAGKVRERNEAPTPPAPEQLKEGLEALGKAKSAAWKEECLAKNEPIRPGLRQLRPEDLPEGVTAAAGYDHRGLCIMFTHKTLGEIGKIVVIQQRNGQTLMQADLTTNQEPMDSPNIMRKKELLSTILEAINLCFPENAGR